MAYDRRIGGWLDPELEAKIWAVFEEWKLVARNDDAEYVNRIDVIPDEEDADTHDILLYGRETWGYGGEETHRVYFPYRYVLMSDTDRAAAFAKIQQDFEMKDLQKVAAHIKHCQDMADASRRDYERMERAYREKYGIAPPEPPTIESALDLS